MAVLTETPLKSLPDVDLYRMPVDVFLRAVEADVFPKKDNVFLRNGRIYIKTARTLPQAVASETALAALSPVLPLGWSLWVKNPILTDAFSAPLPDLCVVRGTSQDYYRRGSFPKAEDVALVVEIAYSSLDVDRTDALVNYAAAGLPVYWIVNLIDWHVEVYTSPETVEGGARYASREDYPVGRDVPVTIDGVGVGRVPAGRILPGESRREP